MAAQQTTLRPDLELVLNNLEQLRKAYLALKAFNKAQGDVLQYEKERYARLKEEMNRTSATFSSLEEQRMQTIDGLKKEKDALKSSLLEAQQECEHLRQVYIDRNIEHDQFCRLQDELETLKAKLALLEDKHKEEMSKREKQYSEELEKYKTMLKAKQESQIMRIPLHPALLPSSSQEETCKTKKRKKPSFKWPALDISEANEKHVSDACQQIDLLKHTNRKMKKLYTEDKDAIVDV